MKKLGRLLMGTAVAVSSSAYAGAFDFNEEKPNVFPYTYIEAGYVSLDGNFDGFGVAGSYAFKPNFSVIGSYATTSAGASLNFNILSIGLAHHYKFENNALQNTDISFHLEFVSYEIEFAGSFFGRPFTNSVDDNGLRFGAKGRHQLNDKFEVFAGVSFETTDINGLVFTPGVVYSVTDKFAVVGSYELISDSEKLMIGGRMYF